MPDPLPIMKPYQSIGGAASGASQRVRWELFAISFLVLFLEMACIRWFPAHVLFLTFFTNIMLLASFLGMSLGCLAARRRDWLPWTPILLALALAGAHGAEWLRAELEQHVDAGQQSAPQLVFFGTENSARDVASFAVPIEVVGGVFFLLITLVMVGPGQVLGRCFAAIPNRLHAYSINILGSIAGIIVFACCSWYELPPGIWFLPIAIGLGYFLFARPVRRMVGQALLLAMIVVAANVRTGSEIEQGQVAIEHMWSPYYRIDYYHNGAGLVVNLMDHQFMVSNRQTNCAYALPHLLQRDAQGPAFQEVLIIGAGSGNDVSRALQWGANHIDAVEIDPAVQRIGLRAHPDRPYEDPRVERHIDDGRSFLRAGDRQYDLIIYALVDSLVMHSSYNNLRLESYLFTQEAFADVRRRLKPNGMFVVYNYFRQGWIVARLHNQLQAVFGAEPLVLTLPPQPVVPPGVFDSFTMIAAGDTSRWREAFRRQSTYWLRRPEAPSPATANGFVAPVGGERSLQNEATSVDSNDSGWQKFMLARVPPVPEATYFATDDWPFLYLQRPMIPDVSLRTLGVMGGLAAVLLLLFRTAPDAGQAQSGLLARLFLLGMGFMLIETKAVVQMALLFGSTWMVNTVVFLAVLLMILAANVFVLKFRPRRIWPYYLGLLIALALCFLIPLGAFLGMERIVQITGSCLLTFAPVLFAAIIFALSFDRSGNADRAWGVNLAGAMCGGLLENIAMLVGFQYLVAVAAGVYGLSWAAGGRD
jgi:spermidine synthase